MILYGSLNSGHSYKVRLFLALAGVEHKYQRVDLSVPRDERPLEFRSLSKFGEVPVLFDEGRSFCQSNAILLYLSEKIKMMTGLQTERQSVLEWLSWETNRIGFSIPNLRLLYRSPEQSVEVVDYLRLRALDDLDSLEKFLSNSEFLLPSGMSIADISCCGYLYWLHQTGLDVADYPALSRWLNAIAKLHGWRHPNTLMQTSF